MDPHPTAHHQEPPRGRCTLLHQVKAALGCQAGGCQAPGHQAMPLVGTLPRMAGPSPKTSPAQPLPVPPGHTWTPKPTPVLVTTAFQLNSLLQASEPSHRQSNPPPGQGCSREGVRRPAHHRQEVGPSECLPAGLCLGAGSQATCAAGASPVGQQASTLPSQVRPHRWAGQHVTPIPPPQGSTTSGSQPSDSTMP